MMRWRGFTLIEILIASAILAVLVGIGLELFKFGTTAANRGSVSAQVQQNARIVLDRIVGEMREAVPLPVPLQGYTTHLSSAVILPGPGSVSPIPPNDVNAEISNSDVSSVGCGSGSPFNLTYGNCVNQNKSPLNSDVEVPSPTVQQNLKNGPQGFLIFSELLTQASNAYSQADPSYADNLSNYVWVMYAVSPPVNGTPAELLRYTFPVMSNGNVNGIALNGQTWTRSDSYFVISNTNEANQSPPAVISLSMPQDALWIMISHAALQSQSIQNFGGSTSETVNDPSTFTATVSIQQWSQAAGQSANLPFLNATVSATAHTQSTASNQ